jgi:hypothetical protein
MDRIVLGTLGGLAVPAVPGESKSEVAVALAGPVVNAVIVLLVVPPLIFASVKPGDLLFSPLNPQNLFEGDVWLVALRLTCWINCLLLLNLFPAYPLDGGHALAGILRPLFGSRAAVLIVGASAMLAAMGLLVMALLLPVDTRPIPSWLPLSLFAIFLFFSGKQQIESWRPREHEDSLLGYDFSEGYTSLERSTDAPPRPVTGFITRWLEQRRENRQRKLAQIEAEEENRVDQVLARLNDVGIDALSVGERALLDRVSKRYRQRLTSE